MAKRTMIFKVDGLSYDGPEELRAFKEAFKVLKNTIDVILKKTHKDLESNFEVSNGFNSNDIIHVETHNEPGKLEEIDIDFILAKKEIRDAIVEKLLEIGVPATRIYFSAGEHFQYIKAVDLEKKEITTG